MPKINLDSIETGNEANAELWNSRYAKLVDLVNGKLDAENLANSAVTAPKLAPNSVLATKVPDGELDDTKWINGIAFRASRTTARNVGSSFVNLGCDTIQYNLGDGYDNTGDATRFTAPADGIYAFGASMYTEASSTRRAMVRVTTPDGEIRGQDIDAGTSSGRVRRALVYTECELEQGQTVSFQGWSTTTVDINSPLTFVYGHLITRK